MISFTSNFIRFNARSTANLKTSEFFALLYCLFTTTTTVDHNKN